MKNVIPNFREWGWETGIPENGLEWEFPQHCGVGRLKTNKKVVLCCHWSTLGAKQGTTAWLRQLYKIH